MEDIFKSGEPYVVYCQIGTSKALPKLLVDAGNMLPRGYNTAMMDCNQPVTLYGGKSVYSQYEMNDRDVPAFVVANGDKPKQFNRNSFYNVEYFVEFVKVQTTPKLKEIESQAHFKVACTDKEKCIVIGHKGKLSASAKEAIETANGYFRTTKLITIDTSKYAIKLDEVLTKSLETQMGDGKTGKNYLSGLCYSGRSYELSKPATGFVRRITESEVYDFLKNCVGNKGLDELNSAPTLETKKKVLKKKKSSEDTSEKKSSESSKKKVTTKPAKQAAAKQPQPSRSQYADDGMEIEDI